MIINLYGFPMAALPLITMIGTLVDPPATMVNAIGSNVASMMVARIMEGTDWLTKSKSKSEKLKIEETLREAVLSNTQ
jgi:Na+/H+-dicarboxylate symporter